MLLLSSDIFLVVVSAYQYYDTYLLLYERVDMEIVPGMLTNTKCYSALSLLPFSSLPSTVYTAKKISIVVAHDAAAISQHHQPQYILPISSTSSELPYLDWTKRA